MPIRILLADDHNLVRQGLSVLLAQKGFCIAAEASDGLAAVRLTNELQPDVAILDIGMRPISGIEATREIVAGIPGMKVILLTMHAEETYVLEAFHAGASGYVVKSEAGINLARAIQDVCGGSTYVSPKVSRARVKTYLQGEHSPGSPLTLRERQVLQLVAEGKTAKEIAYLLGISPKTAEAHRNKITNKVGVHGTAGLVRYAIRSGLVQS